MNLKIKYSTLFLIYLISISVKAQNPDNFENIQVKTNEAQLIIDRKELSNFKSKVRLFETAFLNRNADKVNKIKEDLIYLMKREWAQSKAKIDQDKKALKQSKKEYKLAKKRTRISKKDYKMSEDDKADAEAYKLDKKAENRDKERKKETKKAYRAQKKLSKA